MVIFHLKDTNVDFKDEVCLKLLVFFQDMKELFLWIESVSNIECITSGEVKETIHDDELQTKY